ILKKEKNYRNFLIADALLVSALMADSFYAVNAIQKFSLPESYAGIFTVVVMSSMIGGTIIFGFLADRYGHKLNLLIASSATAASSAIALISPSIEIYYVVFIGSASTATLINMSRLAIVAELCSEEDRPTYISLTNVITAPFILSAIAGGWFANQFGYNIIFIAASLLALTSVFLYMTIVK